MGYRLMTKTLSLKYGLVVPRTNVMEILRERDPAGVAIRRQHSLRRRTYTSMGPNYMWHADGHDKLKRYGFCIHGCIDGFSRRMIWVECASTNNNSAVICYYYMSALRELKGCPFKLRTDCGTENVLIAANQCHLRQTLHAHVYGTSQHNQRIESWWCYLRKMRTQWWIEYFNNLEHTGTLDVDSNDQIECLRFCYMNIIRRELAEVKALWNNHRIRKSKEASCPAGVPDHLFCNPGRQGLQCLVRVTEDQCAPLMNQCLLPTRCQDSQVEERLATMCVGSALANPSNTGDALRLFLYLKLLV